MSLIQDASIVRDILLNRVAAGFIRDNERQYLDIANDIRDYLLSNPELTDYKKQRLERTIQELLVLVQLNNPDFSDIVEIEAKWQQQTLALVNPNAVLPPKEAITAAAKNVLIDGAAIGDWYKKIEQDTRFAIERSIRSGVAQGKTNAEIVKDIIGIRSQGEKGVEPLKVARRNAIDLVRTTVQAYANAGNMATIEANADIVKAVEATATLDNRTSITCRALDGKQWSMPDKKPIGHNLAYREPPYHRKCRTRLVPITRTFKELGLDMPEFERGTRASETGQIDQNIDMKAWLEKQDPSRVEKMLGKGRAQLFLDGKVTLSQMIDPRTLQPLTLQELQNLVD